MDIGGLPERLRNAGASSLQDFVGLSGQEATTIWQPPSAAPLEYVDHLVRALPLVIQTTAPEALQHREVFDGFTPGTQRMAFYAGCWKKQRFTFPLEDARRYGANLPKAIEVEQGRIDRGAMPHLAKAILLYLPLSYTTLPLHLLLLLLSYCISVLVPAPHPVKAIPLYLSACIDSLPSCTALAMHWLVASSPAPPSPPTAPLASPGHRVPPPSSCAACLRIHRSPPHAALAGALRVALRQPPQGAALAGLAAAVRRAALASRRPSLV